MRRRTRPRAIARGPRWTSEQRQLSVVVVSSVADLRGGVGRGRRRRSTRSSCAAVVVALALLFGAVEVFLAVDGGLLGGRSWRRWSSSRPWWPGSWWSSPWPSWSSRRSRSPSSTPGCGSGRPGSRRAWRGRRTCRSRLGTGSSATRASMAARRALASLDSASTRRADDGDGLVAQGLRLELEAGDAGLHVLLDAGELLLGVGDGVADVADDDVGGADAGVQRAGRPRWGGRTWRHAVELGHGVTPSVGWSSR